MEERKLIWKIIGNGKSFLINVSGIRLMHILPSQHFYYIIDNPIFDGVFFPSSIHTDHRGTLLKLYQTALPDYVSAFLISITDEVYNRSVGIISITAIVAIWSAAKGISI